LRNLETPNNIDFDLEHLTRKRPVPILNRLNWRNWFQLFKLHIIRQGLDFVLDQTESDYAQIKQFTTVILSTLSTASTDPIDNLARGIEGLKFNTETQR
jgi:hypothetical protein